MQPIVEVTCATCGQPKYKHSGGYPNTCPIIATWKPTPSPDLKADNAALANTASDESTDEHHLDMPACNRALDYCGSVCLLSPETLAEKLAEVARVHGVSDLLPRIFAKHIRAALQATEPRP